MKFDLFKKINFNICFEVTQGASMYTGFSVRYFCQDTESSNPKRTRLNFEIRFPRSTTKTFTSVPTTDTFQFFFTLYLKRKNNM